MRSAVTVALTQIEADALLAMPKRPTTADAYDFPAPGGNVSVPLVSHDGREEFLLDVWCGKIVLNKVRYQNRARGTIALARLELNGRPHTNPDGQVLDGNHLHRYREGYADKWAEPVPPSLFPNIGSLLSALDAFLRFCNIAPGPQFSGRLEL